MEQPKQNLNLPELPEPHKHFVNKKFGVTLAVLLILGGAAYGGVWYWQKYGLNLPGAVESIPVVETFTPRPSPTLRTYMNTKYGFEFKYSTEKYILNASDGVDYENTILKSKSDATEMTVYFAVRIENRPFETVRQSLKKVVAGSNPVESPVVFAGIAGYSYVEKYPDPNPNGVAAYAVLIQKNGVVYYIYTQKYNSEDVKQIFSSFHF